MAPPLQLRVMLFFQLWREIEACFGASPDVAFLVTLAVFYGTHLMAALGFEIEGLEANLTSVFAAWGLMWLYLFVWLAPALIKALPVSVIACGGVALILAGMRACAKFQDSKTLARSVLYARPEAGVLGGIAALVCAMISQRLWHSVLPFVGMLALVALPFTFGWLLATHAVLDRTDAVFGDRDRFTQAGVNEDQ